jgi:mono/diheme cytochrome c family protein
MKKISLFASLSCALVLGASVARAADAADNWAKNCAACHGKDGAGHTKAGRMKGVKDMTDSQYQQSFTDEQAADRIKNGLNDAGGNSKMKAFGDTLSDSDIKDLVAYVRSLKK